MKKNILDKTGYFPKVLAVAALLVGSAGVYAQQNNDQSPREAAPAGFEDIEGQWVAIINEDWLWRMRIPPVGDFSSIPYNDRAREVGEAWNPSMANSCLRYGAAGIMRQPLRLRIEWDGDDELVINTDFGQQERNLYFNQERPENVQPSLQGYSVAEWSYDASVMARGYQGPRLGTLHVETTDMIPAWLRTNGAPYSDQARLTEYYDLFTDPAGQEWLVVTSIVNDPVYLNTDFVTSSHFKREEDRGNWDPRPCDQPRM